MYIHSATIPESRVQLLHMTMPLFKVFTAQWERWRAANVYQLHNFQLNPAELRLTKLMRINLGNRELSASELFMFCGILLDYYQNDFGPESALAATMYETIMTALGFEFFDY